MGSEIRILRPGLLVRLKTEISGGVQYERCDLENRRAESGAEIARWETTKRTLDADEHAEAVALRSRIQFMIRKPCSASDFFGLMIPESRESELDDAVREAQALARDFNKRARYSRIGVYVAKGRIADADEQALRGIAEEIRGLLESMENGVRSLDAKAIRAAASQARAMAQMLDAEQAERVKEAVKSARKAAREIVKRVEKNGEESEAVLREITVRPIASARFAMVEALQAIDPEAEADRPIPKRIDGPRSVEIEAESASESASDRMPIANRNRFAGISYETKERG